MSGGYFDYRQSVFSEIADSIEQLIVNNQVTDQYGYANNFTPETIEEFRNAVKILHQAAIYAQRIDWLVSGDDGEDSFHLRIKSLLDSGEKL